MAPSRNPTNTGSVSPQLLTRSQPRPDLEILLPDLGGSVKNLVTKLAKSGHSTGHRHGQRHFEPVRLPLYRIR